MKMTEEQQQAVDFIFNRDASLLVAPTGEGKTVIALTAINELIIDGAVSKVIVACPAKVLSEVVWPNEAAKWPHLRALTILQLEGDAKARIKQLLSCPADIVMVSLNNLEWLLNQEHESDGIIIDEISKAAGKHTQGLRRKSTGDQLKWRVGMSATPVSQSFEKLYSICRILDKGKALGTNKNNYLQHYFISDYHGHQWTLMDGADKLIMTKVEHLICAIEDKKASKLPPLIEVQQRFDMPADTREKYEEMKKDFVVEEADAEAVNEAVKSGKLRQIASGFIYTEGKAYSLDDKRFIEAKRWQTGLEGECGIIFYEYEEHFLQLANLDSVTGDVSEFKEGNHQLLLAQFNSLSHGIEGLQYLTNFICFFAPLWSRDAREQSVGRVWRQGQIKAVTVTDIVCNQTLDDVVISRVQGNADWMDKFMDHMTGGK